MALRGTICLFLPSGKTFTFRRARITSDNETTLRLDYIAMSDGREGFLTIQKSAIVGHSWKAEDEV